MKTIVQRTLLLLCAALLVYCGSVPPKDSPHREYAYLAPLVKKDNQWTDTDLTNFVSNLNDKHLVELAFAWEVIKEGSTGVSVIWTDKIKKVEFSDPKFVLDSLGGRNKVIALLRNEIRHAAYPLKSKVPIKWRIKWHEIVKDACETAKVNSQSCDNRSSFLVEKALLSKVFQDNWEKLSQDQRKRVIENSTLSKLDDQNKSALVTATGAGALAVLNATVAMSGFAFYTTMSSAIAATAGVIGVTLPFAAYTGAATTVATLTGPVGWAILGVSSVAVVLRAFKPDEAKIQKMVISLHLIKAMALEGQSQLNDLAEQKGLGSEQKGPGSN